MTIVKQVYTSSQSESVKHEMESIFFENSVHRHLMQNEERVYVSFSLLWGDQCRVRFLQASEDPWWSTPQQSSPDLDWFECTNITEEHQKETLS